MAELVERSWPESSVMVDAGYKSHELSHLEIVLI
jgi:hypothetical protein